jgi:hypothetical protein
MKGFEDPRLLAYEEFAVNVAILFGASNAVAKKDMRDVINFEIKLANVRFSLFLKSILHDL